jgi:hypothetical protein
MGKGGNMKGKANLRRKIGMGLIATLLAFGLLTFPAQAHPDSDISIAAMYKAVNLAIDELWEGKPPRRSDIKIVTKLPTAGAKHAAQGIVGIPEGEAPPEWTSDKPGEFEVVPVEGTDEKHLKLENFEITIIRKSSGEEYTWKADPDLFTEEYLECINKEARGEELKWWEADRCDKVKGRPISKSEESIGMTLANELHDNYAHPLDDKIVGKVDSEGTMLYLAAALAESGDKGELETLREKVKEASECVDGMHHVAHHKLVPIAEEMGKGIHEAHALHDLGHKLMASIYKVGEYLDEIEKTNDVGEVKGKAGEMLEEAKRLKEYASEAHIHSTDPATHLTEQKPLRLKDAGEVIEIKYEELGKYHSEMAGKGGEGTPIAGPISFAIIVGGLVIMGVLRWRRARG